MRNSAARPVPRRVSSSRARQRMEIATARAVERKPATRVVPSGAAIRGAAFIQLPKLNDAGSASGNCHRPATDQMPRTASPAAMVAADVIMATNAAVASQRSRRRRHPADAARSRNAAKMCSPTIQTARPASATASWRRAPADARKRIVSSGSRIQSTSRTARVGGLVGPRMAATSTTDEAKTRTAKTASLIWR